MAKKVFSVAKSENFILSVKQISQFYIPGNWSAKLTFTLGSHHPVKSFSTVFPGSISEDSISELLLDIPLSLRVGSSHNFFGNGAGITEERDGKRVISARGSR